MRERETETETDRERQRQTETETGRDRDREEWRWFRDQNTHSLDPDVSGFPCRKGRGRIDTNTV